MPNAPLLRCLRRHGAAITAEHVATAHKLRLLWDRVSTGSSGVTTFCRLGASMAGVLVMPAGSVVHGLSARSAQGTSLAVDVLLLLTRRGLPGTPSP